MVMGQWGLENWGFGLGDLQNASGLRVSRIGGFQGLGNKGLGSEQYRFVAGDREPGIAVVHAGQRTAKGGRHCPQSRICFASAWMRSGTRVGVGLGLGVGGPQEQKESRWIHTAQVQAQYRDRFTHVRVWQRVSMEPLWITGLDQLSRPPTDLGRGGGDS